MTAARRRLFPMVDPSVGTSLRITSRSVGFIRMLGGGWRRRSQRMSTAWADAAGGKPAGFGQTKRRVWMANDAGPPSPTHTASGTLPDPTDAEFRSRTPTCLDARCRCRTGRGRRGAVDHPTREARGVAPWVTGWATSDLGPLCARLCWVDGARAAGRHPETVPLAQASRGGAVRPKGRVRPPQASRSDHQTHRPDARAVTGSA